jgi:subtilisin family serine protease
MIIEAWHSAGVIPIFANGNSGPSCGSATFDPLSVVISVGASTLTDGLASFSSASFRRKIDL